MYTTAIEYSGSVEIVAHIIFEQTSPLYKLSVYKFIASEVSKCNKMDSYLKSLKLSGTQKIQFNTHRSFASV